MNSLSLKNSKNSNLLLNSRNSTTSELIKYKHSLKSTIKFTSEVIKKLIEKDNFSILFDYAHDTKNPICSGLRRVVKSENFSEDYTNFLLNDFSSLKTPTLSLLELMNRINYYLDVEPLIFPMVVILFERLKIKIDILNYMNKTNYKINSNNIHLVFVGLFFILTKLYEDNIYDNKTYSSIFGVDLNRLFKIEKKLLIMLDYNIYIKDEELEVFINSFL